MGRKISKQECKIISRSTSSRPRELSWQEPPRRSIRGGMLGHCLAHISFDLLHHKQSCKIRFSSDPSPIIGYPWLTHSLPPWLMWLWPLKMPTQNFLLLLVLLMLMLRNMLTTVWSRFWSVNDFEAEIWARFGGWSLVHILWLKIGQHFEPEAWPNFGTEFWRNF